MSKFPNLIKNFFYVSLDFSLEKSIKFAKFEKIFFQVIEIYHTIILLLESRKTVYTTLRKVVIGPRML